MMVPVYVDITDRPECLSGEDGVDKTLPVSSSQVPDMGHDAVTCLHCLTPVFVHSCLHGCLHSHTKLTSPCVAAHGLSKWFQAQATQRSQNFLEPFLDLCASSLREGYANLLCTVPILTGVAEATAV